MTTPLIQRPHNMRPPLYVPSPADPHKYPGMDDRRNIRQQYRCIHRLCRRRVIFLISVAITVVRGSFIRTRWATVPFNTLTTISFHFDHDTKTFVADVTIDSESCNVRKVV